jgi:hypothetical protein
MSPTMAKQKQQRRQSKDQLANAVRKHFNSMGITENEVVVDFLYKVRWQGWWSHGVWEMRDWQQTRQELPYAICSTTASLDEFAFGLGFYSFHKGFRRPQDGCYVQFWKRMIPAAEITSLLDFPISLLRRGGRMLESKRRH